MLAIGAVIGAGIFSSIGTAAAGEVTASGEVVRYGAGPALILSFVLLGVVCGAGSAVLRGTFGDDPAGRKRVRVFIRDAWRAGRVDYRLGSDPRERDWQHRGGDCVERVFQFALDRCRHRSTTASWIVAFVAVVSLTAVLLVFQYGQPRIFFAMARDGLLPEWASRVHPKYRTPHITTVVTGIIVAVGSLVADENEIYDLTNIGTLSAFVIVCIGVLVLRIKEPERPRPFRVPGLWFVSIAGAFACFYTMLGLPTTAWERFAVWLAIGIAIYFFYGYRNSKLKRA
jgi:amino acid transporter